MRRFLIYFAFALILAAGAGALLFKLLTPPTVAAAPVRRGPAVATVFATGFVEAKERRVLRASRPGVVAEILAREWAEVKAGAPLVKLRDTARVVRLERAQAEFDLVQTNLAPDSAFRKAAMARIAEAKENADLARKDLERNRPLLQQGVIQQSALDELETRARAAGERYAQVAQETQATLEEWEKRRRQAQAEIDVIRAGEEDDIVSAPIDGIVLSLHAEIGEAVGPEKDLVKVGDIRELIVEADVDEDDISRVREGQEVLIRLAGSDAAMVKGRLYEVFPDALRVTKSFKVRVSFPEAKFVVSPKAARGLAGRTELPGGLALFSGMSAELGIVVEKKEGALVFPRAALSPGDTVLLEKDGRVEERAVKVGIRSFDQCEALGGLAEGDRVVVEGRAGLKSGQRVRLK